MRALLEPLYHGSQARLRTFPDGLGDRGDNLFWFEEGQEEGRVQIALHSSKAARTGVPAL